MFCLLALQVQKTEYYNICNMPQLSIYTYIFQHADSFYIYNSEHGIIARISERLYSLLYNRDFTYIPPDFLKVLIDKGILIEPDKKYIYYDEMKMRFLSASYDKEHMGLVIVPFSGCNFDCPYCFECKKHPKLISEKTENELIDFVNAHSARNIELTWYGGEPLVAFKNIKSIYYKIVNNTKVNIKRHELVTNGYLLNQEMMDFFHEAHLNEMQITLDGIEEHHNQTRYLKDTKQGTFHIIVDNIRKAVECLPDCNISIRVNVNKNNEKDFFEIYDKFSKEFKKKTIAIYPGFIREETPDRHSLCYNSIESRHIYSLYEKIKDLGGNVNFFPRKAHKGCMVNKLNSYIIGPEGEIYKCWNDVSNPKRIVGYINKKEITNKPLLYRYMNETTPFSDSQCKDCLLFPVCSGGCAWYQYKNIFEEGKFDICSLYKDRSILERALIKSLEKKEKPNILKRLYV